MSAANEPCRVYRCPACKATVIRPAVNPNIPDAPYPKPCDRCGHALNTSPWTNSTLGVESAKATAANPKTLTNLTTPGGGNTVLVVVADDYRRVAAREVFREEDGYYVVVAGLGLVGQAHDFVIYTPQWASKLDPAQSALWREMNVMPRFRDPAQRNELHLS